VALAVSERPALLGSVEPRLWTRPLRELTRETSLGFEVCDFAEQVLEIDLLPWQRWLFIHGLELNPDGATYRFRTVLVLVARQNGKTTALVVLSLWRMVMDQARMILGTSTNLDYARMSWRRAAELGWGPRGAKTFQGVPGLEGEFREPRYANGQESLLHVGGGEYRIGTASRTGGRSMSNDLLILDELREHKTWEAWSASSKTTNARPRGQRWALSNAGDDSSLVLNYLRDKALAGGDLATGIFEWSAPDGCDAGDRAGWAQANPAAGYMGEAMTEATIASDFGTDPEPVFRTEVLCQRVPRLVPQPVSLAAWEASAANVRPDGEPVFFVTMAKEMTSATVAVAALHRRVPHVDIADHRPDVDWLTDRLRQLHERYPTAKIAAYAAAPVRAWKPTLAEPYDRNGVEMPGFDLELMSATDASAGCSHLERLAKDQAFTHSPDDVFVDSLVGAQTRTQEGGSWVWDWRTSTGDLAPIAAATGALWELEKSTATTPMIF
jgi:hypothetical protein